MAVMGCNCYAESGWDIGGLRFVILVFPLLRFVECRANDNGFLASGVEVFCSSIIVVSF